MKRIKTTAANAVKKGLVKEGDNFTLKGKIIKIDDDGTFRVKFSTNDCWLAENEIIYIQKTEPKPIDFGKDGLVLKLRNTIVCTTGYEAGGDAFTAYVLESDISNKGFSSNDYDKRMNWQDITENYYLNNPK